MSLTIALPHLLPDPASPAMEGMPPLPATVDLLSRASGRDAVDEDYHAWLARAYGYRPDERPPFAALRLSAEGGEPGDREWVCMDPVNLLARLDDVAMSEAPVRLDEVEADALVATLEAHLAQDGVTLARTAPGHWHAGCAAPLRLVATAVDRVRGRPIAEHLPSGPDSPEWLRRASEIEMLLHAHPVNAERERRGEPPVNGVWLWGAGRFAAPPRAPYAEVWADEPCARGLAAAAGATLHPAAATLGALHDALRRDAVVLAVLGGPAAAPDPVAVERDWLDPLRAFLDGPSPCAAQVVLGIGARMVTIQPRALPWHARLAFWRSRPALAQAIRGLS